MMGRKKRSTIAAAPVFPFPAEVAEQQQQHHFSDYGFDPQLHFFQVMEDVKRPTKRHHHKQQQPPLDSARFKLQKPISKDKKHHPGHSKNHHRGHRGRAGRRWWSSAASAAFLFFKRPCQPASGDYCPTDHAVPGPLYLADVDMGGDASPHWTAARAAPGQLAAAELGAASAVVPYVSLRGVNLLSSGSGGGGGAPATPIYLVT